MKRKRTEIAIEIDETIHLVGHENELTRAWCVECAGSVAMVTPQQAAVIARVNVRAINRRVEDGGVHFLETPEGTLLVCVNSLS